MLLGMSKKVVAVVALLTIAGVWALLPVHRIGNTRPSSQVVWHGDEALLLVQHRLTGWNMRRFNMAISLLGAFGVPSQDSKLFVTAFRITPSVVEEHHFEQYQRALGLMIFEGRPHTGDFRWTGTEFVPDRLNKDPRAVGLYPVDKFSDVDGWSKRTFLAPDDESKPIVTEFVLGGHNQRLIASTRGWIVAIDLDRQNGAPAQRLVSIDTQPTAASKNEYESLFRN